MSIEPPFRLDPPLLAQSRSRIRSPSPTRKLLALLEEAVPAFNVRGQDELPSQGKARELRQRVLSTSRNAFFPEGLRDQLSQNEAEELYDSAVCGDLSFGTYTSLEVLRKIDEILVEAKRCFIYRQDEAAWMHVVASVLKLITKIHGGHGFQMVDIRTQAIATPYLPQPAADTTNANRRLFDKRTDYAVAFDIESDDVVSLRRNTRLVGSHEHVPLSQMTDTFTSSLPLFCPVEVKRDGGDQNEAELQLGVWLVAALRHYSRPWVETDTEPWAANPKDLPRVGWAVIGHVWSMYITWETETGMTMAGPYMFNLGTQSRLHLFRLINVWRMLLGWAKEVHWAAYAPHMMSQVAV